MKPMESEVIYERKYPRIDYMEQAEHYEKETAEDTNVKQADFESFLKAIYDNTKHTPIPRRGRESEEFIKEAIKVSELYQLDARITRHYHKISVKLAIDFGVSMKYINRLFGMADEIDFFKDKSEHDLAVYLDFYTHVVVRNGLAIDP